jgi:hypothetical protein
MVGAVPQVPWGALRLHPVVGDTPGEQVQRRDPGLDQREESLGDRVCIRDRPQAVTGSHREVERRVIALRQARRHQQQQEPVLLPFRAVDREGDLLGSAAAKRGHQPLERPRSVPLLVLRRLTEQGAAGLAGPHSRGSRGVQEREQVVEQGWQPLSHAWSAQRRVEVDADLRRGRDLAPGPVCPRVVPDPVELPLWPLLGEQPPLPEVRPRVGRRHRLLAHRQLRDWRRPSRSVRPMTRPGHTRWRA